MLHTIIALISIGLTPTVGLSTDDVTNAPAVDGTLANTPRNADPDVSSDQLDSARQASNHLGYQVFRELLANADGNILISPLGISLSLGVLRAGSTGDAQSELDRVAGFSYGDPHAVLNALEQEILDLGDHDDGEDFRWFNQIRIWSGPALSDAFEHVLGAHYGGRIVATDDASDAQQMNSLLAAASGGFVTEALTAGGAPANVELVQTTWFLADFHRPFDATGRAMHRWFLASGDPVGVDQMERDGTYGHLVTETFTAARVPLEDRDAELLLFQPNAENRVAFEANFSAEFVAETLESLNWDAVSLRLPLLSLGQTTELSGALAALGLSTSLGADFAGARSPLSALHHHVEMRLDEHGSQLSPAQPDWSRPRASPRDDGLTLIDFNRPFLFLVVEEDEGTILFMGRMSDPRAR